ncbi:MAG: class I SAM-dependent methyltransferase [Holophagales bacterium]|nr:class I SAM-dependent methyltransferase [Holophagales bacterium]
MDSFQSHDDLKIIEIGSQDVNGSIRSAAPPNCKYIGVDFVEGKGVDVVLDDPYSLPFNSEEADIVLSSSCMEHSEMFWLVYLEMLRILKPKGLIYLNAPSNGLIHRYPVDCWRFYPDSGHALVSWARRNSINAALLESYLSLQEVHPWNDFVAVFVKDEKFVADFPKRILHNLTAFQNGIIYGKNELLNPNVIPEDQQNIIVMFHKIKELMNTPGH